MKDTSNFCNPDVTVEAWYTLCKSKELRAGTVRKMAIGPTWFAVRRFKDGTITVSDRHCPHMGADLLLSKERQGAVFQCHFHGLKFDPKGNCVTPNVPDGKYNLRTYPIMEKYGLVWVYLGDKPKYEIPELGLSGGHLLHLPSKKIRSHHHIVISNPLDKVHVEPVHSLEVHKYSLERNGVQIIEKVSGLYKAPWMKLLTGLFRTDMPIVFSSYGSSISVADAKWNKTRVVILFTARQDENNQCSTNTAIWLSTRNPFAWIRALIVILVILKQDVDILNSIDVKTNFSPADEGMIAYKKVVDSMPIYKPTSQLSDTFQ